MNPTGSGQISAGRLEAQGFYCPITRSGISCSTIRRSGNLDPKHLHHFVPEMVDHFRRDSAGPRLTEGPGGVAM